ncbi:MAG TPA: ferritin [Thermoplasmatales archaeon]|nr:ferritin [Thermoplasmatales archaeon]
MIPKKMEESINKQINEEFYSAYLYLAMSGYFESVDLPGFAHWMHAQYLEEMEHGMKFWHHLVDRGGTVKLYAIQEPQREWDSPLAAFQAALEHERHITGRIHALVDLAEEVKDRAAYNLLQWYVDEQVEEEASVEAIIARLEMVGGSGNGMLMVDRELGQRQTG